MNFRVDKNFHQLSEINPFEIVQLASRRAAHVVDRVVKIKPVDVAPNPDHGLPL
jgi:hypothetical protein